MNLTVVTGTATSNCNMVSGTVQVCNKLYGSTGWLGLASINITGTDHITQGTGRMRLGAKFLDVGVGDTIVIEPGTAHCITNIGKEELKILCACSPAYSHDDTDLL